MTLYDTFKGSQTRHGTPSGWRKHQDLKEPPCAPCNEYRETIWDEAREEGILP